MYFMERGTPRAVVQEKISCDTLIAYYKQEDFMGNVKSKKEPVKAILSATPLAEEVATAGSTEVNGIKPSLLNSIINLISILAKILERVHELLMGDRVYMTHVSSDGTAYSGFITKEEVRKSEYAVDWKLHGLADVLQQMIEDGLLEEYFPANSNIRGLRVIRTFDTATYCKYVDHFASDGEFYNLPFIFSGDGKRFNSNSWRQFKARHQTK